MPHLDEMETRILDKKTATEYKNHLLRLMIDLEINQNKFLPEVMQSSNITEKTFKEENGSIEDFLKECFNDKNDTFIIGSFHKIKNNALVAFCVVNIYKRYGITGASVGNIYVDPYYRRIHVGKLLLDLAIQTIKEHPSKPKYMALGVIIENKIPQKIYNKLGFKPYFQSMYTDL